MSAIDLSVVQELLDLCDDGDVALLGELVELFLRDAPARVTDILEGCDAGDLERVEKAAHALKGSAGNLGAIDVQAIAERLQIAGRSGDADAVRESTRELPAAYDAAAAELRALAARFGGGADR